MITYEERKQLAIDEVYVSIRKLHDMAMSHIVNSCTLGALFLIIGNQLLPGIGGKKMKVSKITNILCERRKAWDKVSVSSILVNPTK